MYASNNDFLIYGIGNPARGDDGLGWIFVDRLDDSGVSNMTTNKVMQLNIEDAETCSKVKNVLFVDASLRSDIGSYRLKKIKGEDISSPFTHSMNPDSVVQLARELYNIDLNAWVLEIRGENFSLGSTVCAESLKNLDQAFDFVKDTLFSEDFKSQRT